MAKRQNPRHHSSGDSLEMRQLMSGVSGIQVNLNAATRTLSITGTESADDVSIQQNDGLKTLTVLTRQADGVRTGNDLQLHIGAAIINQQIDDQSVSQRSANLRPLRSLRTTPQSRDFIRSEWHRGGADSRHDIQNQASISGILADVAAKYGIPGLSASVIIGDRVLTGAAGVRAAGAADKVRVTDRFGNGSTTKAMTATLAAVLVERGVIRWDSTIGELFPEMRGTIRPEYLTVTLEQLLQHRGGVISDDEASEALIEKVANTKGPAPAVRRKLIPEVLKEQSSIPIGEFNYSNSGYVLAGAMLERVTRVSYERLMQKYIFNPLGMRSATFDPPMSNPRHPRAPIGHLPDGTPAPGDRPPLAYLTDFLHPAGSDIRLNVGDWSKFIRVHLGETVNGVRLLTPGTLDRLHRGVEISDGVGYASGWVTIPKELTGLDPALGRIITHNGSDGVWLAEVTALPESGLAIAIMANATVDKFGNSLDQEAFAEIKLRLLQRFAPASQLTV